MTAPTPLAVQVVDGMQRMDGVYPGYRRAHARGACFSATFTPTGEAAKLTTAGYLQSEPVSATVRLSNGSGSPYMPDNVKGARGIAVKFHLADGSETDLIAVNMPVFLAATPEQFLELVTALAKDPETGTADPAKVQAYLGRTPTSIPGFQVLEKLDVPESYATVRYWALHAFTWVNADGARQSVRYRWEPDAGVRSLTGEQAGSQDEHYLAGELIERLGQGPVTLKLHVILAEEGDPTNDATSVWPADRQEIVAGTLSITAPVDDQAYWAARVFDPTNLTAGIELSDDPLLGLRHAAYSVSYDRRSHNH